jgi:hypothetical protein
MLRVGGSGDDENGGGPWRGESTTVATIFSPILRCRARLPHFAHIARSRLGEFGKGWFRRRLIAVVLRESPDLALERA